MWFRVIALALLTYVIADFSDPSVPGVFFFDSEQLFIDGVVPTKLKTTAEKPEPAEVPHRPSNDSAPILSSAVRVANGHRSLRLAVFLPPRSPQHSVADTSSADDAPLA
jgi:hypothetical protein